MHRIWILFRRIFCYNGISYDQWSPLYLSINSSPCTFHCGDQWIARSLHSYFQFFDLLTFRTSNIFLLLFSMNLSTYYYLYGFMIGVHLYILFVLWFYSAFSLACRWPWGSNLCPCWPRDRVFVLFWWGSCQHISSIRMQSQECTCLRYWGCIMLALHSLKADFNLAVWFWKSVTLAVLGESELPVLSCM